MKPPVPCPDGGCALYTFFKGPEERLDRLELHHHCWPETTSPCLLGLPSDLLLSGPCHCLQHGCISLPHPQPSVIRMDCKSSPFLLRGIPSCLALASDMGFLCEFRYTYCLLLLRGVLRLLHTCEINLPLLALLHPFSLEGSHGLTSGAIQSGGAWTVGTAPFLSRGGNQQPIFSGECLALPWKPTQCGSSQGSLPQRWLLLGCSLVTAKWRLLLSLYFRLTNSGCQRPFLPSSWPEYKENCAKSRAVWSFIT